MSEPAAKPARGEAIFRWSLIGFAGLILVGWMIFAALDTPTVPDNYTNGFSHSPGGHSALAQLIEQNGRDVRVRAATLRLPEFDATEGATLALLEPRSEFVEEFRASFRRVFEDARSRECSLLLAMPKRWYRFDRIEGETEVINEYLERTSDLSELLELAGLDDLLAVERPGGGATAHFANQRIEDSNGGPARYSGAAFEIPAPAQVFRWTRSIEGTGHYQAPEVLLETADGRPVAVRIFPKHNSKRGGIVLLSDPDLLSNRFLDQPGAATLVVSLFKDTPPRGELIFEETLHGFAADASLEYLAVSPPGLWVTLSIVLLLALFGWREATVVRPASAEAADRQARIYAVDGIARMMARARDHGAAVRALVRRARLVLGNDPTTILAEGRGNTEAESKGGTKVTYASGQDEQERLINAASSIAAKMRAGDASAPVQDDNPQQGKA